MKILIFGGSGLLGCALRRQLKKHELVVPSHQEVDILDKNHVAAALSEIKPDFVINTVAYTNVDLAESESRNTACVLNIQAPEVLAKLTGANKIPLIHISTDYVFAGDKKEGYVESDEPKPVNFYGESKFSGEQIVLKNNPWAYIIRTSRLFGAQPESRNAKKNFVEVIVQQARQAEVLPVNAGEVASPTLVDDLAKHIEKYIFSRPAPGIYHIANSGSCSRPDYAQEIINILGLKTKVVPKEVVLAPGRAVRPAYSVLLSTKIPAMRPWQEALKDFLSCKQCLKKL